MGRKIKVVIRSLHREYLEVAKAMRTKRSVLLSIHRHIGCSVLNSDTTCFEASSLLPSYE